MERTVISAASAAKIVKADLLAEFPDTNFSVTSNKKTSNITIKWVLGKTDFTIKEATEQIISDMVHLHGLIPVSSTGVGVTYIRLFPDGLVEQARQKITAQLMQDGRGLPAPETVNEIIMDELRHTSFDSAEKYL